MRHVERTGALADPPSHHLLAHYAVTAAEVTPADVLGYFGRSTMSILRFFFRPAGVSLDATG